MYFVVWGADDFYAWEGGREGEGIQETAMTTCQLDHMLGITMLMARGQGFEFCIEGGTVADDG